MRCWVCITLSVLVLLITISFLNCYCPPASVTSHSDNFPLSAFPLLLNLKMSESPHFVLGLSISTLHLSTVCYRFVQALDQTFLVFQTQHFQFHTFNSNTRPLGSLQVFSNSICSKLKSSSCPHPSFLPELLISINHITIHARNRKKSFTSPFSHFTLHQFLINLQSLKYYSNLTIYLHHIPTLATRMTFSKHKSNHIISLSAPCNNFSLF